MGAENALTVVATPTGSWWPRIVDNTTNSRRILPADFANAIGSARRTVLAGTVANSALDTLADVTALSFTATSGVRYGFRFWIIYSAAATTTGSRWSINGPATTLLHYRSEYSLTTTTRTSNDGMNAYNLPAASNASSAATASNVAEIEGLITTSSTGAVIARFASEVSGSAITALAGSYVEWWVV